MLDALLRAGPACRGDAALADLFVSPDAFEEEPDEVRRVREKAAKTVCLSCPARAACLSYALAVNPDDGVWAGLTSYQLRRRAARVRRASAVPVTEVPA
ncbi:WhiB family transcriptional regulator [Nonomuraea longicatena]|uniref:WhiB family transcriptional regulator n=1 Tax=Nonomuraea longicatena TaxID=83682 RepID=UPI0031D192DE